MVGGPDKMDNFKNDRENYRTNEVALDYNAAYQGLMAAMLHNDMIKANLIELKETFSAIPENELLREARRDVPIRLRDDILSNCDIVPISESDENSQNREKSSACDPNLDFLHFWRTNEKIYKLQRKSNNTYFQ